MATESDTTDSIDSLPERARRRLTEKMQDTWGNEDEREYHPKDRYLPYSVANDPKPGQRGKTCANCGQPGFEHKKKRATDDAGRHRFFMVCPE